MIRNDLMKRCCVFAVDFKPRIVGGINVIPNFGKAGGAPTWLRLGDGSTASTLPIPLAGYGASFTGTQYVDTGVVDRYERTDQFSLYASFTSSGNSYRPIISSSNAPINFRGISMVTVNSSYSISEASLYHTVAPGNYMIRAFSNGGDSWLSQSHTWTWNGSALAFFLGGESKTVNVVASSLSGTVKGGGRFIIGGRNNGLNVQDLMQNISLYAAGIFDGLLHPADIAELDTLVLSGVR
jgi:hypothetical protein